MLAVPSPAPAPASTSQPSLFGNRAVRCKLRLMKACLKVLQSEELAASIGILPGEFEVLRDSYLLHRSPQPNGRTESTMKQIRRVGHQKLLLGVGKTGDTRIDLLKSLHSIRFYSYANELQKWMASGGKYDLAPFTHKASESLIGRQTLRRFCSFLGIEVPKKKIMIFTPVVVREFGFAIDTEWKGTNRFLIALHDGTLLSDLGKTEPLRRNTSSRTQLVRLLKCTVPVDLHEALKERPISFKPGSSARVKLFPERSREVAYQEITMPPSCTDRWIIPHVRSADLLAGRRRVYIVGKESGTIYEHVDLVESADNASPANILPSRYLNPTSAQIRRELNALLHHSTRRSHRYLNYPVTRCNSVTHPSGQQVIFLGTHPLPSEYPFAQIDIHVVRLNDALGVGFFPPGVDPRYSKPFQAYKWELGGSLAEVAPDGFWTDHGQRLLVELPKVKEYLQARLAAFDTAGLVRVVRVDPMGCYLALHSDHSGAPFFEYLRRSETIAGEFLKRFEESLTQELSHVLASNLVLVSLLGAQMIEGWEEKMEYFQSLDQKASLFLSQDHSLLPLLQNRAPRELARSIEKLFASDNTILKAIGTQLHLRLFR